VSAPATAAAPTRRVRLGWLGPTLAAIGITAGTIGIYVMATSRPQPAAFLDVVAVGERGALVVRAEAGAGHRNFIELYEQGAGMRWRALVPPYAGSPTAPGVQVTTRLVNVRVARGDRPELFSLALADSVKVGGLALADEWPPAPGAYSLPSGLVLDSGTRSFQLLGDAERGAVFEVSRTDGTTHWRHLTQGGLVRAWTIGEEQLAVETTGGQVEVLDATTGAVLPGAAPTAPPSPALPFAYDESARLMQVGARAALWPPEAMTPRPHHVASATALWMITADTVALVDLPTLTIRWSSRTPGPVLAPAQVGPATAPAPATK
jgi:hypothetical protein